MDSTSKIFFIVLMLAFVGILYVVIREMQTNELAKSAMDKYRELSNEDPSGFVAAASEAQKARDRARSDWYDPSSPFYD